MTAVSAGLLLVTLGLIVFWVRSQWRNDAAWYQSKKDLPPTAMIANPEQSRTFIFMSGDGGICLAVHTTTGFAKQAATTNWETSSGVRYPVPWSGLAFVKLTMVHEMRTSAGQPIRPADEPSTQASIPASNIGRLPWNFSGIAKSVLPVPPPTTAPANDFRFFAYQAAQSFAGTPEYASDVRVIIFPYWIGVLVVGLATLLSLGFEMRTLGRRRWIRNGLCGNCGYDLRASSERCPECGQAISASPGIASDKSREGR